MRRWCCEDLDFDNACCHAQFCVPRRRRYATDIGGLLRRAYAMFVELDRISVTRRLASMRLRVGQIDRTDRIISIAERCGRAPGTMIMVATRRKHGNEGLDHLLVR